MLIAVSLVGVVVVLVELDRFHVRIHTAAEQPQLILRAIGRGRGVVDIRDGNIALGLPDAEELLRVQANDQAVVAVDDLD